jgi:hypothetical protein
MHHRHHCRTKKTRLNNKLLPTFLFLPLVYSTVLSLSFSFQPFYFFFFPSHHLFMNLPSLISLLPLFTYVNITPFSHFFFLFLFLSAVCPFFHALKKKKLVIVKNQKPKTKN